MRRQTVESIRDAEFIKILFFSSTTLQMRLSAALWSTTRMCTRIDAFFIILLSDHIFSRFSIVACDNDIHFLLES